MHKIRTNRLHWHGVWPVACRRGKKWGLDATRKLRWCVTWSIRWQNLKSRRNCKKWLLGYPGIYRAYRAYGLLAWCYCINYHVTGHVRYTINMKHFSCTKFLNFLDKIYTVKNLNVENGNFFFKSYCLTWFWTFKKKNKKDL